MNTRFEESIEELLDDQVNLLYPVATPDIGPGTVLDSKDASTIKGQFPDLIPNDILAESKWETERRSAQLLIPENLSGLYKGEMGLQILDLFGVHIDTTRTFEVEFDVKKLEVEYAKAREIELERAMVDWKQAGNRRQWRGLWRDYLVDQAFYASHIEFDFQFEGGAEFDLETETDIDFEGRIEQSEEGTLIVEGEPEIPFATTGWRIRIRRLRRW